MFNNNLDFDANAAVPVVGKDSAALQDPYGLDFNSDGRSDVLWHNPTSGSNELWLTEGEHGNQVSESLDIRSIGEGWKVEGIADFNQDGYSDLLVRNERTGDNAALFRGSDLGGDYIGRDGITGIGADWEVQGVSDFDNDEHADILWHNNRTGENVIWYMEGDTGASIRERSSLMSPGRQWKAKGVGDFDRDGYTDVLWRDQGSGENLIWYMRGNKGTDYKDSERVETFRSNDWELHGVGDFNQDGAPDLLWHEKESGTNEIWQLGGQKNNKLENRVRFSGKNGSWIPVVNGAALDTLPNESNQPSSESPTDETVNDSPSNNGSDNGSDNSLDSASDNGSDNGNGSEYNAGNNLSDRPESTPTDNPESTPTDNPESTPADNSNNSLNGSPENSPENTLENNSGNSSDDNLDDGFNIEFDYRFDTNNWFDSEKRAVLEKAADIWEDIILDEFENIAVGTTVHATDPNGNGLTSFELESEIDDIRVFAFAQDLSSNRSLAEAGATTYQGDRNTSTVFQPWLGEIVFNDRESWYINPDTSTTPNIANFQADMLSVAVHELGHILGISSGIDAFSALIQDGKFTGEASTALNNGEAIPLDSRGSHIEDDFEIAGLGENSLDPNIAKGTRKLLTLLDVALLDDIGYSVDYSTLQPLPDIEVLSIRNGDLSTTKLRTDNEYTIRWEDNLAENVKIDLYEGNRFVSTIVNSTPSDGEFNWRVPSNLAGDKFFYLRISSAEDANIFNVSDQPFQVEANPFINIDTPSDNSPLRTGTQFELTWSDNIRETIRIELYKEGSYHRTITGSTSSDGSYQWNIPTYLDTSRNYHLRFTSTSDSSIYDESAQFWIQKD
ncbi:MAG: FG-GAP-like repeat-containing protein [Phormidesmis sp.]